MELAKGSYQNLNNFVQMLHSFQEKDMDVIVPITSFKGMGKTTLALQGARTYFEKYYPDEYSHFLSNLKQHVTFDYKDTNENILTGHEFYPLVPDEAVRFMLSEDWGKVESRYTKKVFVQARPKHRLIFPCIPNFWWLDKKYREDMVLFWCHVISRGVALLFTPDIKIGVDDIWHRKEFQKLPGKVTIFSNYPDIIKVYKNHPCFLDVIKFDKLPQDIYDKYMTLRLDALARTPEPNEPIKMKRFTIKTIISAIRMGMQGTTVSEIATKLSVPRATVESWLVEGELKPMLHQEEVSLSSGGILNPSVSIINNKREAPAPAQTP